MYQKRNNNWLEVISLFSRNYKRDFYLREISKLTKIPLKTTQNLLKELEESRILQSKIHGKNKYFLLNLGNIQTKLHMLHAELYTTAQFLEKYVQFKTFLKELNTNNTIIIFGSFAKFNANKNSDVDLLLIGKNEKLPSHLLPNKIHLINMTEINFIKALEKQEPFIKEMQENHAILNNHSFYVNVMWSYYEK